MKSLHLVQLSPLRWQVAGTEWKLVEEGKNPDLPQDEERFATWDDVMGKRQRAESGAQASTSSPGPAASKDLTYYRQAANMHACDEQFT